MNVYVLEFYYYYDDPAESFVINVFAQRPTTNALKRAISNWDEGVFKELDNAFFEALLRTSTVETADYRNVANRSSLLIKLNQFELVNVSESVA